MSKAETEGYEAGRAGIGVGANPYAGEYAHASAAWRKGYLRGQREREIEEDEANGDLFRTL